MRRFPLPRPESDPRFTIGLLLEVAKVLKDRGFPELGDDGRDLVALQEAHFGFICAPQEGTDMNGLRTAADVEEV
jgi:hypothetical protein